MHKVVIKCPHCGKVFDCRCGGMSLHCYDYQDMKTGKRFVAGLADDITECIECNKEFNLVEHSKVVKEKSD